MPEIDQHNSDAVLTIRALSSIPTVPSATSSYKDISRQSRQAPLIVKLPVNVPSLPLKSQPGSKAATKKSDSFAASTAKPLNSNITSPPSSPGSKPPFSPPTTLYTTTAPSAQESGSRETFTNGSATFSTASTVKKCTSLSTGSNAETSNTDIYPIDAGIIRCICGYTEDDGFTIQCEKCNVWQHAICVNIQQDKVPEIYLCDNCGNLRYDTVAARNAQAKRLGKSLTSPLSEMETYPTPEFDRFGGRPEPIPVPNKVDNDAENSLRSPKDVDNQHPNSNTNLAVSDATPSQAANPESSLNSENVRKTRTQRSIASTGILLAPAETKVDTENESEKKFSPSQMYNSYFVPISQNRFSHPSVRKYVESLAQSDFDKAELRRFSIPEYKAIELPDVSIKLSSDHPKQKFSGFSRFGLFVESYLPRDHCVINFLGEVMTKEQYKSNLINQYREFGCPKPGVLFHPTLPICVDARLVGSKARFIRRSCQPNCEVQTVVIDNHVAFIVFSKDDIKPGTELTLPWEWDERHPVQKLIKSKAKDLSAKDRLFLVGVADMAAQRGAHCACRLGQSECLLARMKKINGTPRVSRTSTKTRRGVPDATVEQDFEITPSSTPDVLSTFYSPSDSRQNGLGFISKLASKKLARKYESYSVDSDPDVCESAESSEPEKKMRKTELVDKAVQTPDMVSLRHESDLIVSKENGLVNAYASMVPAKNMLYRYLQAMKTHSMNGQAAKRTEQPPLEPYPIPKATDSPGITGTNLRNLNLEPISGATVPVHSDSTESKEISMPDKITSGIPEVLSSNNHSPSVFNAGIEKHSPVSVPESASISETLAPHITTAPSSAVPTSSGDSSFALPSRTAPPTISAVAPGSSNCPSRTVKKKLSFADYKRKQMAVSTTKQ